MLVRAAVLSAFVAVGASAQLTAGNGYECSASTVEACADEFMEKCRSDGFSNAACLGDLCGKPPGCETGNESECFIRENFEFPSSTPAPTPCGVGTVGYAAGTGPAVNFPTGSDFYGSIPPFDSAACPAESFMCTYYPSGGIIPQEALSQGQINCHFRSTTVPVTIDPYLSTEMTVTISDTVSIVMAIAPTTAGTVALGYHVTYDDSSPFFGSSNAVTLSARDINGKTGDFSGLYLCVRPMGVACFHTREDPSARLPFLTGPQSAPTIAPQHVQAFEAPTKDPHSSPPSLVPLEVRCIPDAVGGTALAPSATDGAWDSSTGLTAGAHNYVDSGRGGMNNAPECPMTYGGRSLRCVTTSIDGKSTGYGVEFYVPSAGDPAVMTMTCSLKSCDGKTSIGDDVKVEFTRHADLSYSFEVLTEGYYMTLVVMKSGNSGSRFLKYPICDGDCTQGDPSTLDSTSEAATAEYFSGRTSLTASVPMTMTKNGPRMQALSHVNICVAPACALCEGGFPCDQMWWPDCV